MVTRRAWLIAQAVMAGADTYLALEAVSSTALAHPDWDMGERRTLDEWEGVTPPVTFTPAQVRHWLTEQEEG